MAAEEGKSKNSSFKPITDAQRFRYIGFEVFPGKPKDLFKTDGEQKKYVEGVRKKREKGETLRDQCTLLEERVSFMDRLVLTLASVIIFASLFIPWYSAYNEIVEETAVAIQQAVPSDSAALAAAGDTLAAAGQTMTGDSVAVAATTGSDVAPPPEREGVMEQSAAEEVITSYVAKKKVHKEYSRLLGISSFIALGSVGSYVFSSGGIVVITAIIFLLYALLCIGLPAYTLYGIYMTKGDPDQRALRLKKMLRLNWAPLILFVLALILSFFGAEYGFDAGGTFTSLGNAYGPGVFLGVLSWGIILSLCAFILVAAKGVEI